MKKFLIIILLSSCSHQNTLVESTNIDSSDSTTYSKFIARRKVVEKYSESWTNKIERENDSTIIGVTHLLEYWYEEDFPNFGLFDWNKDGHLDLFFEYYASCGTGIKFRVDVYLYDETTKQFKEETISFMNPTFYYEQNVITSYYVGHGGGYATKFKVENGNFIPKEEISIDINDYYEDIFIKYEIEDLEKSTNIKLSDTMMYLPQEYSYYDYNEIIKSE
jgi:hypothetical protein